MAEFTPDFTGVAPWQGEEHDTPADFALRRWLAYQNADDDMDFATACELAPHDREVFDALRQWALEAPMDDLPIEMQAKLAVALLRKPPRRGRGGHRPSQCPPAGAGDDAGAALRLAGGPAPSWRPRGLCGGCFGGTARHAQRGHNSPRNFTGVNTANKPLCQLGGGCVGF